MPTDREIVDSIRKWVGRDPIVEFSGETCVSLSLWDESEPFRGLIRHHSTTEQQAVLGEISKLRGLRELDIHQNWLRTLPQDFGALSELRVFNASSNNLGVIPEWVWGLRKLESLYVGANNLDFISPRIGELVNLKVLYLHKNRFRELPREILNLRGLHTLSLYFNPEVDFPLWVTDLPDIETFSWAISGMTRFPREITSWKNLKYLTLAGCQFEDIEGIEDCSALLGVRLNKGRLKKLPKDLSRLKLLRQATLQQNELSELPESFAELQQLQMLNIAVNNFEKVPASLKGLPNLNWLCAHDNPWRDPKELDGFASHVEVVREHPFGWQRAPMWTNLTAV